MSYQILDTAGQPILNCFQFGNESSVASGAASAQSAAFSADTRLIRVVATLAAHVAVGPNPTATGTSTYLPPNVPVFLPVAPGGKLAAIQDAAAGTVFYSEVI